MAATSRKTSRARQRHAASLPAGGKRGAVAKRTNGGTTGRKSGAVKAKAANGTAKRDKIVRDTFKMPRGEYALIDELKQRCRALGVDVKKSEVLRAGLVAMRELTDERLSEVMRPLAAARTERAARKQAKSAAAA